MNFLRKSWGLDYRSLALYRMLMGLIVTADVLYRLPDLTNFYTDIGLVPRSLFLNEMTMPWSFSLHLANGSLLFAAVMFGIHLLFGLMLIVGYKSSWAMFGAYLMTASVHNRNWLVNNGGDDVMRVILFLSIFLPLNKCFSIDSAMQKEKEGLPEQHLSFWTVAFFFQVFAIYFVSYILKDSPIWRKDFTAIFYSGRLDIFATPIGVWMRGWPWLEKLSTIFTIYLEWLGPLLLVFGGFFGRHWWKVRTAVVVLFWGLHLGIIMTMFIGLFPYTCIVMWSIFLPGPLWDKVLGIFRRRSYGQLAIFYDGECGVCQKGVRILREFFLLSEVKVEEAQSRPDINAAMLRHNSWVVINEKGESFFRFGAMLEIMRHSPLLNWKVKFFSLTPIYNFCDRLYVWVSHNRFRFSKATQFLNFSSPKRPILTLRWLVEGMGVLILATLIMWNLTTIKKWGIKSPFFQTITRWLHIYQEWNMFAPYPKMDNVWIEVPGTLSDGRQIELLTGDRDIFGIKNQKFYDSIPNEHWRKFYLNVSDRVDYARYFGGFLCRKWNDRNIRLVPDTTLRKMEIIVYSQPNLPDGEKGGISRKLSWKHWCFDEDFKRDNPGKTPR